MFSKRAAPDDLEALMQKVSLVVSLVALGLMGFGLVDAWVHQASLILPGERALPLPVLVQLRAAPASLVAMSAGIVLLALLPTVRVLLALALYVRQRSILDTFTSLAVLLELLTSMRTGG